ncbi:uncharacterized protein DDB_G0284459 isoform X2 [Culicoides brevitarsis]|uniref:uncharacterized protein DDB_G0284459 isoform X2 n=1 Tax=Culicoides brevitarsis TaxID=469753 RepID=UPI00307CC332
MINTTTSLYLSTQQQQQPQTQQPEQQNNKKQSTINKTDDNLFALESDQISKLFPKCRPKACDVNLNPISPTSTTEKTYPGIIKSLNMNKDREQKYNARQYGAYVQQQQQQQQQQTQQNPYSALYKGIDVSLKDIVRTRTPNTTPASTVLNSPDLNDYETKMHYGQLGHHPFSYHNQIKVGRSPVESCLDNIVDDYNAPSPISPTMSPQNLIISPQQQQQHASHENRTDLGDVVIFDDIGSGGGGGGNENSWKSMNTSNRNLSTSPIITDNEIRQMKHRYLNESYNVDDALNACHNSQQQQQKNQQESNKSNNSTQKIIGGLQIADYEGSPRRFGNNANNQQQQQQRSNNSKAANYVTSSPSMFPPRPGFPKRVTSSYQTSPHETNNSSADSGSRSSGELADNEVEHGHTRNFTLSPETTDYDSNCGDLDSEVSLRYTGLGGEFGLPNDVNGCVQNFARIYNSMPVLEDGLSSGHASDTENNNPNSISMQKEHHLVDVNEKYIDSGLVDNPPLISTIQSSMGGNQREKSTRSAITALGYGGMDNDDPITSSMKNSNAINPIGAAIVVGTSPSMHPASHINIPSGANNAPTSAVNQLLNNQKQQRNNQQQPNSNNLTNFLTSSSQLPASMMTSSPNNSHERELKDVTNHIIQNNIANSNRQQVSSMGINKNKGGDIDLDSLYSTLNIVDTTPPPPAPVPHRGFDGQHQNEVQNTLKDIRSTLQKTQKLPLTHETPESTYDNPVSPEPPSPVWIPRHPDNSRESFDSDQPSKLLSADEEEADTDLETDRLLGQQRLDDQGFFDDKVRNNWSDRTSRLRASVRSPLISTTNNANSSGNNTSQRVSPNNTKSLNNQNNSSLQQQQQQVSLNNKSHASITRQGVGTTLSPNKTSSVEHAKDDLSPSRLQLHKSPTGSIDSSKKDDDRGSKTGKSKSKEGLLDPTVLIEGVLFRARYLGSTQLVCEGQPTKSTRMMQAEEAVSRIKAPEGESQPSTEVDLFISTEKIMVLNTDLKEIMMDHALRTISYIADIGDLVVLMARRRFVQQDSATDNALGLIGGAGSNEGVNQTGNSATTKGNRTPKMICHVFESEEAQFIAQSIGQAFQVAYMEFLKANGIEDHSFMKEMDYQEVLNSQEIFGDELEIFAKKELQKEVVVPKAKGEILGVVIVESGWGSMLPTVVIANLASNGAAARCGQLNIGDQIIAINGLSLVGLPLSTCQSYIKNTKNQTAVKFTVVPCAPVVEVKIKRPNTKYQLGFSVQNGVICSLLRGGIAERGGVRVGHRIIEINNQSVVAVPHEKIVNLLATSVGEILMKTMPTSMFRLLTGQENPVYI